MSSDADAVGSAADGDEEGDAGDATVAPATGTDLWTAWIVETATYGVVVAGGVTGLGAVASIAAGSDLVGLKVALFLLGFVLLGYGSYRLRPAPAWKDDGGAALSDPGPSDHEAWIADLPPARWYPLPDEQRVPLGLKLMVTSILLLAVSFVMEAVFGVVA